MSRMEKVVDYKLEVDGETFQVTALQMGNPNCCIFVDDFESLDWRADWEDPGEPSTVSRSHERRLCARRRSANTSALRIWERGVGETTLPARAPAPRPSRRWSKTKRTDVVEVLMPGGKAKIQWRGESDDGEVVITGSAEVIYGGEWLASRARLISAVYRRYE